MAARSKARKRAVDVLYEADVRNRDRRALLAERVADGNPPIPEHAVRLVEGVEEHAGRIDALIEAHAANWTLERLPDVDRAILRLGTFEILWSDEVPDSVAISEAKALATELSTDESPKFVHGLLARIAEVKPTLV